MAMKTLKNLTQTPFFHAPYRLPLAAFEVNPRPGESPPPQVRECHTGGR